MNRIVRCTFPFPPQTPHVEVAAPCVDCPSADRAVLDHHASIPRDDTELQSAIRSFAQWLFAADQDQDAIEESLRYAADLYTRDNHEGTCVPKTLLFAQYKALQFMGEFAPRLSDVAIAALRGEPVASWPDGEVRSGPTWNEMFGSYSSRYE